MNQQDMEDRQDNKEPQYGEDSESDTGIFCVDSIITVSYEKKMTNVIRATRILSVNDELSV